MHPFRFGIINETMAASKDWFEQVRQAEALGYHTWLLRDHFVPDFFGEQYAPLIALAMAARVTSTLRLGTMVLANDYRHPVMLAKEVATLDALSDGRVELGLGAGWLRTEYDQAGMPFDSNGGRIARLEEAIQILKALWSGAPAHFAGKHYTLHGLSITPCPIQRPYPRLFLGGGHPHMLRLAGREADSVGILTSSVAHGTLHVDPRAMLPEAIEQKLSWIREGAGKRFDQIELSIIPTVRIANNRQQATEQLRAERGWESLTHEDIWSMPSILIGSLAQIAQDIHERRERYGFSYYVFSDRQMASLAPLVAQFRSDS